MNGWRGRRVAVTGATGIVGSWLCEELLRRGAAVTALVLDDDPQSRFVTSGIDRRCTIVRGTLANVDDCMRLLNRAEAEAVFHLGAQTIVGAALRDPLECFESNVRGTYNVLESARRIGGTKAIVVASSDKAYGESDVLPYVETMPLRGRHPYDVSKSCADLIATAYHQTYGLPVTIARCGNIYGGGDLNWSRIVPGTIRSLLLGERPVLRSDGGPVRDYVYVRDVVDAYLTLADASARPEVAGEAFNVSPQTRVTVREIVDAIGRAAGVRAEPLVENVARCEIRAQTLDATKARERLGWTASWSLEDGLRETVAWYREHLETFAATAAGR
ncbi:MAG TPA: NAD-dependent epimerase/dehydratase family protein [Candidatus Baltobacteraceae bacterium]|nr:NAD-dependent epimerase/dehydratase family protein [Candidatus Baltobacteraceae bacterium]